MNTEDEEKKIEETAPKEEENPPNNSEQKQEISPEKPKKFDFNDFIQNLQQEFPHYLSKTLEFVQKNKIILIVSFISFLILILAILLRSKRKFEYDQQIPYVWNNSVLQTLNTFYSLQEHDHFLLLYGPHGFGKTRAIIEYAKMTSSNHLPFIFDFRIMSKTFTLNDLKELIKSQIIDSLMQITQVSVSYPQMQSIIQTLTAIKMLRNQTGPRHDHRFHHGIKNVDFLHRDKQVSQIISLLCDIAENIEYNPTMSFRLLFNAIDSMKEFNPSLFVIHADALLQSENQELQELYKTFLQTIVEFSSQLKNTPLIVEISDTSNVNNLIINLQNARPVYISGFSESEAEKTLVGSKIFSRSDIRSIYPLCPSGSAFSQIMNLMRVGNHLPRAKDIYTRMQREKIRLALFSNNKAETSSRTKILKDLSKKDIIQFQDTPACKHLLSKGIITKTIDTDHVVFTTKLLKEEFININRNNEI